MKFGMVWHDAGPMFGETTFSWYFTMILAVYAVFGIYLFKAGLTSTPHSARACVSRRQPPHGTAAVVTPDRLTNSFDKFMRYPFVAAGRRATTQPRTSL